MQKVEALSRRKEIVSRSSESEFRAMVVAGMLGTAVFLIEAGAIELILRADRICQGIRATEWAFNPRGCQPEAVTWMLRGLSRGLLGALQPDLSPVAGVATMALAMGLIAALLGALPARRAIPVYFVVQIAAAAIFTALGYLLFFIA